MLSDFIMHYSSIQDEKLKKEEKEKGKTIIENKIK